MGKLIKRVAGQKPMVDAMVDESSGTDKERSRGDSELELTKSVETSERVKKIAVGGVLASLSIAVAPSVGFIARIAGWGIALFDHVSLFWMVSFLIGGPLVGAISLVAGAVALFPFDPFAPFGPVFKLMATLPMMVIPWYGVRRFGRVTGGEALSKPRFYATLMVIAFLVRLAVMIPVNLLYGALVAPFLEVNFILTYAIILNAFQSFWDATIPFIIVHSTGLFKYFKMW
jgi:hypothetical protein